METLRLCRRLWKLQDGETEGRTLKLILKYSEKVAQCRKNPLARQGLQTKIFSPRQSSNRRPSAWEAHFLTTGDVNKVC